MALELFYRKMPQSPGVYFFSAKGGKPLYIGKAANLRARLSSYFAKNQTSLKTSFLLKEAKKLSWEMSNSETEALIREAELIKKYRPKYNVLMRDDKQYFYVGFSKEKFPKVFITHQPKNKADYIGPFTEGGALRSVLKTLRRVFPYCTCRKTHKRPCLNARIARCLGFCCAPPQSPPYQGGDKGEVYLYHKNIKSIKQILSGKNKSLVKTSEKEMHRLSGAKKYEEAGKIRDQIRALERIFEHRGVIKQDIATESAKALRSLESLLKIDEIKRIEAYDIANIQGRFAYGSMAVFIEGRPQKDQYRLFKIKSTGSPNDPLMIREIITRRLNHQEWQFPEIILVDGGRGQLNAAMLEIRNSKLDIKLIALTKDKKHKGDHIFIAGKASPIPLTRLPEPLKNLILRLDSEAHRFAISHYRKLHKKSLLT